MSSEQKKKEESNDRIITLDFDESFPPMLVLYNV